MGSYATAALAFAVTALLTLTLRPVAFRLQLTDKPGGRKHHTGEIPLVGGIAMMIAMIISLAASVEAASYWHYLLPAAILVIVGAVDDRRSIGASARLAVQVCAALIMMLGGDLYLHDIGDPFGRGILGLGHMAIPLSVVITLTVINAYNFVDGIDGLAASMALIALSAGAIATGLTAPTAAIAAVACGAILGFLPFNFPSHRNHRLRAFMGDAGSTLLGFSVVWFTITISQGDARSLSPVAALWFALMPLADFFSCFVRRIARGKLPLRPGREHFHHMLMRAGLSGRQVLGVLVGFGVFYAAVGLIGVGLELPDWALFGPWITLLAVQYFIIKRLAVLLRHRRWKAAAVVVAFPARAADAAVDLRQNDRPPQEPGREAA
jgi:UDP-GlcNAc:undecaprenyl-phosphate GlcNAc-1-phosphate transferase